MAKNPKWSVRVEGLKELNESLADLSRATAGNVLKRAVGAGAAVIAEDALTRAPVDRGRLRANILVSKPKIITPGKAAYARAMQETGDRAIAAQAARNANREAGGTGRAAVSHAGPAKGVGQGILQEFGTAHHPPQPFMRPAWDARGEDAAREIGNVLKEEIDKAVARAARKAARLAK